MSRASQPFEIIKKQMALVTLTSLLFVASAAFFYASPKRSGLAAIKGSKILQRTLQALGWALAALALGLIVSNKGWEVGIPLWLGAWILAAVLSLFVAALWKRAHLPLTALCLLVFVGGLISVSWGAV